MNESVAKAFSMQSFTGNWKIQHKSYTQEYFGEFLYDPIKGRHELTLYGVCIFPRFDAPKISAITGDSAHGEKVSVFDLVITNASSGTGETISKKTVFSFISFCIGDKYFYNKDSIRLRKYSFRCTNLEAWTNCQPFRSKFSLRKKRVLGKINVPDHLIIFEDDIVRIKLVTIVNQNMTQLSLSASYHHKILIEAKGNRKLPYFGAKDSFSYYEDIVYHFFGLMIGRHTILFDCVGILEIRRVSVPPNAPAILLKRRIYSSKKLRFFYARKVDEGWLDEISLIDVLLSQGQLSEAELLTAVRTFFAQFSKFGFVLDDWMIMRNTASYTNHSLPELLYNFEGLHCSLYPECDTKSGYRCVIDALHNVSPFTQYDKLINNKKHKLPFRQRLQDILFIKVASIYSYLTVSQKNDIITYLVDVRNNDAHRNSASDCHIGKLTSCILLCEELIAIMIFLNIGLQLPQLQAALQHRLAWLDLQDILCKEFVDKSEKSKSSLP